VAKTVTITLRDPLPVSHSGRVTEVVLREPSGRDLIEFGEPYAYARADKGLIVHAENDQAIKNYIERCIVEPDHLVVMSQISLVDMMTIKETVLGFFADARLARSANTSSSSSATSTGSAPTGPAT
jgi:hypothetical protein